MFIEADAFAASDAPRAIESAKLLAPDRPILISPLLRELELSPPELASWVRLPMIAWAVLIGIRWLVRRSPDTDRVQAAAEWLAQLAGQHGTVAAVTHASVRGAIARELAGRGWVCEKRSGSRHWSAWSLRFGVR